MIRNRTVYGMGRSRRGEVVCRLGQYTVFSGQLVSVFVALKAKCDFLMVAAVFLGVKHGVEHTG